MEAQVQVAGCVLRDDYGRILLLHRSFGDAGLWYLPGGKVEDEELPEAAAVREAFEELGVRVTLTKSLGSDEFEHEDIFYKFYWFQADVAAGEPQVMETDVHDDLDYFELEDMPSLALSAAMEILENKLVSGAIELD